MQITALDEGNKRVDWFFIYRVPQFSAGANTDKTTGYEYFYYDPFIDPQPPVGNRNEAKADPTT